jgi:hypothetical protein
MRRRGSVTSFFSSLLRNELTFLADDESVPTIQCSKCGKWHHQRCVYRFQSTARSFTCPNCHSVGSVEIPAQTTNFKDNAVSSRPGIGSSVNTDHTTSALAALPGPLRSTPVDNIDTSNAALIIPNPVTPVDLQLSVSALVEFSTTSEMPQPEMPQPEIHQPEIPETPQPEPQPEMRIGDSPVSFTPAVTFGLNVNSPPSRTGTPGPDDEPKRKRISSQNFQRLARRISLSTWRQSSVSSIIPGFKRSESSMQGRASTDDNDIRAEGSTSNSPASSVKGDDKGNSKKKDKKGQ